jgi:7-cyano-7-deazaguanine synthase in queuosine biosynthesis
MYDEKTVILVSGGIDSSTFARSRTAGLFIYGMSFIYGNVICKA